MWKEVGMQKYVWRGGGQKSNLHLTIGQRGSWQPVYLLATFSQRKYYKTCHLKVIIVRITIIDNSTFLNNQYREESHAEEIT